LSEILPTSALHSKNLGVDSVGFVAVIENKNVRADLTRMRVARKKQQKAKHVVGAYRSKRFICFMISLK
jgi:hypothetical protein